MLDEPTANLDPASAEAVADAMRQLSDGRTVLVIAHRPELAVRADRTVPSRSRPRRRRARRGGGEVNGTLRRVVALARPPRARLALSILLGATAVVFGIGLMASAGYLIARAAERPAILSLTTAIVAVRFFGLARPIARYLERLASHDLAFRLLARIRLQFYERIEPLAPAGLEPYRRGDLAQTYQARDFMLCRPQCYAVPSIVSHCFRGDVKEGVPCASSIEPTRTLPLQPSK